jgi:PAS domain S-box-containing protein
MNIVYSYIQFFASISYLFLAVYVFRKNPKATLNRLCSALCICMLTWSTGDAFIQNPLTSYDTAMFMTNFAAFGWIFVVPVLFWFMVKFAGKKRVINIPVQYIIILLFLIGILLVYKQFTERYATILDVPVSFGWKSYWTDSIWKYVFVVYYCCAIFSGIIIILRLRHKTQNVIIKRQSEIIVLTSLTCTVILTFSNIFLLNSEKVIIPALGGAYTLIWAVGVIYAITKYNLFAITSITAADKIISTMRNALIVIDKNGYMRITNNAAASLFKYKISELIGKKLDTILEDKSKLISIINPNHEISTGKNELVCITSKNEKIETHLYRSKLYTNKKLAGFVCILTDITYEKQIQEEFLKIQKLESLGLLAGGIAHDFNNLLMVIAGGWSFLKLNIENKYPKITGNIDKAIQQSKMLIGQLTTFSKGGEPILKLTSISTLLEETTDFVLSGSNILPVYSIDDKLKKVKADNVQISRVIQNIVLNSKEAMPKGGKIFIEAGNCIIKNSNNMLLYPGPYIRISIRDQGQGIPISEITNIFDPYFSTKKQNSGLGLTIAYSIIKKHNGHISVDSVDGKGSTFTIYLPAMINHVKNENQIADREKDLNKNNKKLKILVMDDEEMILDNIQVFAEQIGHTIKRAKNGKEAVRIYNKEFQNNNIFDLVILDLTIRGGMGGYDTFNELSKINPKVKAVVSSGFSKDPIMSNYLEYGFIDVLPKPYGFEDFARTIYRVLEVLTKDSL